MSPEGARPRGRPRGQRRHRGVQGLRAAAPLHRVRARRDGRPDRRRAGVRRRADLGGAVGQAGLERGVDRRARRAARRHRPERRPRRGRARRPPTCWRRPPTGWPTTCSTNTLLTARCPVVFAPAMHTEMWEHPATVANVATLRARGAIVIEPAEGRLTGKDTGKGRLPDPAEIFDIALDVLDRGVGRARPGGPPRRRQRRRHPRIPRPRPLPRQPLVRPPGLCPGRESRPPAAPRSR